MSSPTLFDEGSDPRRPDAPLAARMRPTELDEVVGQREVLGPGTPLRRLLQSGSTTARTSLLLWGPPGTGKTTLAMLVASAGGDQFVELSAVTAGVKDVRGVIELAKREREITGRATVLFVDEVHRFSKTQQDALLPAVENGWVTLVAATTENPSFSVIAPLLSRSLLVPVRSLDDADIGELVDRALVAEHGLAGRVQLSEQARGAIVRLAAGDARRALTVLEAAAGAADDGGEVSEADIENAVAHAVPRYDRDGDQHYDTISAFIKSIRGSDADAALHYLARMVVAGEDPRFIARRLVILASEDIGLADPTALQTATAAMHAVSFIGLPEARITLAHATIALAVAPKSNAAYRAIDAAIADVQAGLAGAIPDHLRDGSVASSRATGAGEGYLYPHADPAGVLAQQYPPNEILDRRYYEPSRHGQEAKLSEVYERIRQTVRRGSAPPVESPSAE